MTRYGYARVSTNDQHPEAQAERLVAAGFGPVYTDKGVSGTQARRKQWDKLLAKLQPGDELGCTKLDRIGRSVANLVEVVADLMAREVELVVLDQNIDTSTPSGKLLFHMLAAIAEFERGLIIERTLDGQAAVRRAGNLRRSLGGPPVLGFREGDEGDDDWQLDQPAAEWLADAAERVLAKEPVEAVLAALPEMHDATGRKVNAKMLRAALQRPASAGLIDGEPAAIAGPLDVDTWNRLQVDFGSRKRGRPVVAGRYPFGPRLRCAKCGNQLTGAPGYKGRDYYACKNPHKGLGVLKPCRGVSVLAEDVHTLIADTIAVWATTPAARLAAARTPETATRRAELEARIADTQDMVADLWSKRQRGHITPARYATLDAEAAVQLDTDAAELDALAKLDAEPGLPPVIEWDKMTPAEQLRTLDKAIETPIVVQPGNGGGAALSAADRITLKLKAI
jgi:DNA invertase Pin-like site-specific DNA recombinase